MTPVLKILERHVKFSRAESLFSAMMRCTSSAMTVRLFAHPPLDAPTADHSTPGCQFLESLALAAIDVGRIDVAEVSRPTPHIVVFGLAFINAIDIRDV